MKVIKYLEKKIKIYKHKAKLLRYQDIDQYGHCVVNILLLEDIIKRIKEERGDDGKA